MEMNLQQYTGGPVMCNAYLLEGADCCVAVDAPWGVADWLLPRLPKGKPLRHLLLTHQHFDHVQGVAELQRRTGCKVHAYAPYSRELTLELLSSSMASSLQVEPYVVDDAFGELDEAEWGGYWWKLRHVPGHAIDGMAYILPQQQAMFVGDILFAGAIGRTDFPGGSTQRLVKGIREKLMTESPATLIYSGHGPSSSVGEELQSNPYVSA